MKSLCIIKEATLVTNGKEFADEKPIYSVSILEYGSDFVGIKFRTIFNGFCYSFLPYDEYQYSLFGNSLERDWLFREGRYYT